MSKGVEAFLYGDSHIHFIDMPPCDICAAENSHWDSIMARFKGDGEAAEDWLQRQEPVRAYNQRYPYDNNSYIASLEETQAVQGNLPADEQQKDPEQALIDQEASEELLAELPELQKHIMRKTAQGYKPRDISAELGHQTSGVVRLNKYQARQTLGASTNKRMARDSKPKRRVKGE